MTRLPRILYAVPALPHVHLEIAKAIQAIWGQENEQTANRAVGKAAVDDPEHPGWPAHTPDGKGGKFRPKDGAFNSPIKILPVAGDDGRNGPIPDVRIAMGPPIDPATGQPFSSETPLDRLGGGEGSGGGDTAGSKPQAGLSPADQLAINRATGAQFEQQSIQALEQQG